MTASVNDILKGAFGPIDYASKVTSESSESLGTSATQLTNASNTEGHQVRRLRVKNWSASNRLGVHLTDIDASTPTIDTNPDGGDPADYILDAGEVLWISVTTRVEVWVVGSAASTAYQATWSES